MNLYIELKLSEWYLDSLEPFITCTSIRMNKYNLKLYSHIKYLDILINELLSWKKITIVLS